MAAFVVFHHLAEGDFYLQAFYQVPFPLLFREDFADERIHQPVILTDFAGSDHTTSLTPGSDDKLISLFPLVFAAINLIKNPISWALDFY